MNPTVIDTLRYANRLKDAGVDTRQAEAMAEAINDELTAGLATKVDVEHASAGLKGDLDAAVAKLEGDLDAAVAKLDGNLDRAVVELKGEIAREITRVDGKIDAVDEKLDALDSKYEAQGRYMFLVLALIAALGLYNAAAPHLRQPDPRANSGGKTSQEMSTTSATTQPPTTTPTHRPAG